VRGTWRYQVKNRVGGRKIRKMSSKMVIVEYWERVSRFDDGGKAI
jgi:hypothetical protein